MQVELVRTVTKDGVRLDGMFQSGGRVSELQVDAACLVHGTGGNFYSSTMFDALAEQLLAQGCSVLRVNTRGHDGMSTAVSSRGAIRLGASYELVDDCRHDLAAWLNWLRDRGCERTALIGHSLGAVKSLYAVANETDMPVARIVALSPPRLSYSWFCESAKKDVFLDTYRRAEQLAESGRPGELMEVAFPLPFVVTAGGYVEKYSPNERYNFLKFAPGVSVPVFYTFGSVEIENNVAFQGCAEALEAAQRNRDDLAVEIIPGADHFYTGVREVLCTVVVKWLAQGRR